MVHAFRLPDLGEGVHEGEVTAVYVSPGQAVAEGDTILEVETDKAAVDIPSPYTGTVAEVRVKPGDAVKVGAVLMTFDDVDAPAEDENEDDGDDAVTATTPDERTPSPPPGPPSGRERPVPASPATRRLARELGVDLRSVKPTGRSGVVTAADIRAAASTPATDAIAPATPDSPAPNRPATSGAEPPSPRTMDLPPVELPDFSRWGPIERMPLRSVRRATAVRMATAWSRIPHVSSQDAVDVTRLEALRRRHKDQVAGENGRLTLTVFVLKALVTALKAFPRFNATLDETGGEIILKHYFHVGVAVNTDHGLIVPVIRDVDRKSIRELAVELADCILRTRERRIAPEALKGGSFTLTNAGAVGGGSFTPIINYPEVAILGTGQARMQPVVDTDADGGHRIVPRLMMPVVLSFDHRVADGADAIGFLRQLTTLLTDPDQLMLAM